MKQYVMVYFALILAVYVTALQADPTVVRTELVGPFTGHDAGLHPENLQPFAIEYYGTDLGFSYEHGGQLHFLFGDTWATEAYAPIEASSGSRFDDGFGVIELEDWPDPSLINSSNIPLMKLGQNPGTAEMSAMDPGHAMDLGKTPMTGFSNGEQQFAIFNVTKPQGCAEDSDCGNHLSCDTGLGYYGTSYDTEEQLTLPCTDEMPGCAADTMQDAEGTAIAESGFCVDTTSTIWADTPAGRVQSTALNQRIGLRSESEPKKYTDIQKWLTNKFVNVTARPVASFDPASGAAPNYSPPTAHDKNSKLLLWGRPGFIGVGKNGRSMGLYFAYVDMPSGPGFSWNVKYYTGSIDGVPQFSDNEKNAAALDLDSATPGVQTREQHDVTQQMSVVWIEPLQKWLMFYGGGITNLPSDSLPICGVLQLFTGTECKDVNTGNGAVRMRTADNPWGPWSAPQDVIVGGDPSIAGSGQYGPGGALHHPECTEQGCATHTNTPYYHDNEYGFFYSANIIEQWTQVVDGEVDILWNASTWDPYRVVLLRTRIKP